MHRVIISDNIHTLTGKGEEILVDCNGDIIAWFMDGMLKTEVVKAMSRYEQEAITIVGG